VEQHLGAARRSEKKQTRKVKCASVGSEFDYCVIVDLSVKAIVKNLVISCLIIYRLG